MAMTAESRAICVGEVLAALSTSIIPVHLVGGLVRYFSYGVLPGGFLQAVLCNDLREAVARANNESTIAALPSLVSLLLMHAPSRSWGSRAAVLAWTTTPDRMEIPQ